MQTAFDEVAETFTYWALQLAPGSPDEYSEKLARMSIINFYSKIDTHNELQKRLRRQIKGGGDPNEKYGL